jgi:DNA-binding PadR family transcriptional regulator
MSQITPDETLLGLLAKRPRHGYELLDCFHDPAQLGEVWRLSTSQLYAVLKRLEADGSTVGCAVAGSDAPTRVEYQITERGAARLQAWLDEPNPSPSVHRVRVEFLSRLYIARLLNIPTIPIVARQKQACLLKRAELQTQLAQIAPGVGRLTLELVIGQLDVITNWLDRCELERISG